MLLPCKSWLPQCWHYPLMASNCHSINKVKINFKVTTLFMKYEGRRHRSLVLMKHHGLDPWQVLGPWWARGYHGWSPDISAPDKVWSFAAPDLSWAGLWSSLQLKYGTDSRPDRLSSSQFSGQLPAFDISWTACVGAVMWSLKPTVSNLHHRNCWNGQQRHSYFYVQLQSNIWDTFDQCSWFINRVISSFTLKSSLKACSANIIENVLLISKS